MSYAMNDIWYRTSLFWEIFIIDRLSKISVTTFFNRGPLIFNKYFSLDFAINRGISWGLFSSQNEWGGFVITGAMLVIIMLLAKYTFDRQMLGYNVTGETLILAGAIGNFADRLIYNGVIDFIRISCAGYTFPLFNIADIAITLGACITLYHSLFGNEA